MKLLVAALTVCLLLTACGSAAEPVSTAEPNHEFKPTLDVNWEVKGNQLKVKVHTDLNISEEHYGLAREHGEGHIHMYLDDGEKIGVKTAEYVLPDLAPGRHKLKVSLHNNDHTPYDVTKTIEFEIK